MNRIILSIVLSFAVCIGSPSSSKAYDDELIHPLINEKSLAISNLDSFVKQNLGYSEGLLKHLTGTYYNFSTKSEISSNPTILNWIKDGGQAEDGPNLNLRYARHFHDPLKSWGSAGWSNFSSSIAWAQDAGQDYSWVKVRDHYYNALTTGSESEYAATFRGVGQLMHLVSDLSVPAHVRNDIHPDVLGNLYNKTKGDFYEEYTKNNRDSLNLTGVTISPTIFTRASPQSTAESALAPAPITALWDQNRYNGSDPSMTRVDPATGLIGLAEYTNANFLSQDSMFEGYAHPKESDDIVTTIDWLHPLLEVAEDGVEDFRYYIMSEVGAAAPIRLAGGSFITRETWLYGNLTTPTYQIDDRVLQDYATVLIPRAIGYSTALLDYFFRGDMEIQGAAKIIGTGGVVTGIDLKMLNTSKLIADGPLEAFGPGTIDLAYQFILPGQSVPEYHLAANPYPVSNNDQINSTYVEYSFNFPSDQYIPAGAHDLAITLIFRGKLGNEPDGIVAKRLSAKSRVAFDRRASSVSYIYTMLPDSSNLVQIAKTSSSAWAYSPAWSPDGLTLAFATQSCGITCAPDYLMTAIYLVHLNGTAGSSLSYHDPNFWVDLDNTPFASPVPIESPVFSPDGTKVIVAAGNLTYDALVIFDVATTEHSYVNSLAYWSGNNIQISDPSWSSQNKIVYTANSTSGAGENIYTINPDGSGNTPLTNGSSRNSYPSWSPDGEWLTFASDRDGNGSLDIWFMDKNGDPGNMTKFLECPSDCTDPTFSPDGDNISFIFAGNIYTINLAGTGLTPITGSGDIDNPAWSPEFLQ